MQKFSWFAVCSALHIGHSCANAADDAPPQKAELAGYLPPPKIGTLADLDPAVIVTPPKGLEIGYVPIVTRQGLKE